MKATDKLTGHLVAPRRGASWCSAGLGIEKDKAGTGSENGPRGERAEN